MSGLAPRSTGSNMVLFVVVAVAWLFGFALSVVLVVAFRDDTNHVQPLVGIVSLLLPALAPVVAFQFMVKHRTGRKAWAFLSLFVASIAALFLLWIPLLGLILAPAAVGGFAIYSLRLLDPEGPSAASDF